jgi:hypothetical protein
MKENNMPKRKEPTGDSPEIQAISSVYSSLKGLNAEAQGRVLRYAAEMLGITLAAVSTTDRTEAGHEGNHGSDWSAQAVAVALPEAATPEDIEGINAVALKWMRRSNLSPKGLQALFSLGVDEIDLVANTVPGTGKRERMRSVLLLKGIAAYLGSGAARVTYEEFKEACLHYNAYDASHFATFLKSFAPEVSGTKEAGLTLTPRGINSATALVRQILSAKQAD